MTVRRVDTKYDEAKATKKAQELANRLNAYFKTNEWKSQVWYNCYWCYCVNLGSISVHCVEIEGEKPSYTAYVSSELNTPGGSLSSWFDDDLCRNIKPEEAVVQAVCVCNKYISGLVEVIKDNMHKLNFE